MNFKKEIIIEVDNKNLLNSQENNDLPNIIEDISPSQSR